MMNKLDQRQLRDALFGALLDAKYGGVTLPKVRQLVVEAYDLDDAPAGPLMPNATTPAVNARVQALGCWGAVL